MIDLSNVVLGIPQVDLCPEQPAGAGCYQCSPTAQGCSNGTCPPCSQTPQATSSHPVRYATGEIVIEANDLPGGVGFGLPWGMHRSFASRTARNHNMGLGQNWQLKEWPHLGLHFNDNELGRGAPSVTLFRDARPATIFVRQGDGPEYVAAMGSSETLIHLPGSKTYQHFMPDGSTCVYRSLTGMLLYRRDPAGNEIRVTEFTKNEMNPVTIERTCETPDGTIVETYTYEYDDPCLRTPHVQRVTLSRDGSNISRASYTYIGEGYLRDLETATTEVWTDDGWVSTGTSYYRYYDGTSSGGSSSGSGSEADAHLVKYVLTPAAFDRLSNDPSVTDPLTAPDSIVALYADNYFEYDSLRRVTKEVVHSGSQIYLYEYDESGFEPGINVWATKTTETLPDSSQNIVYCNQAGQTLLFVHRFGSDDWITYYRYDDNYHVDLEATPEAVAGFDEAFPDLVDDLNYLFDERGLVRTFTYHAESGQVATEAVQEGLTGTPTLLSSRHYCRADLDCACESASSSSGGSGAEESKIGWLIADETVYSSTTGGGQQTTSYCYRLYSDTPAVRETIVTLPVVSPETHGDGVAAQRREVYDTYRNLIWSMDERGTITHFEYDIPSGALVRQIQDADTALLEDVPSEWSTPSGGGRHLVTDFAHDRLGRVTQTLGPQHAFTVDDDTITGRRASWTVYDDGNHVVYSGQGFLEGEDFHLINPVSITRMDAGGRVNEQIQAFSSTTEGTLAEIIEAAGGFGVAFPQSTYTRWTTYQYTDCCLAQSMRVYHDIPTTGEGDEGTHYDLTQYGYDVMKRQVRNVSPGGTITFSVHDVRGRVERVYVGTDDTGATDQDPTGGGSDPANNMVLVTENEYDYGEVGNGYLTRQTQHVSATETRITQFCYDYRGRRTAIDGELDFFQCDTYDNLDRVIKSERYHTTGPCDCYEASPSEDPAVGNLVSRSEIKYDARGRVYQSLRYAVDPETGTAGSALVDNNWYDPAGNLLCSLPAGSSLFVKREYDSLGRVVTQSAGFNPEAEESHPLGESSGPDSIADDVILEQSESTYDAAGNLIGVLQRQRYHNAPATQLGALQDPETSPKARVTAMATYPDPLGRTVATVNLGTSTTRPASLPATTSTRLVSLVHYDHTGAVFETIDPSGMVVRFEYDAAGRRVTMIENYVESPASSSSGSGCLASDDVNRTTRFSYTPDGLQATLTAENSRTGDQVTTYTYGTTLDESRVATSTLLRSVAYPDSTGPEDQVSFTYNRLGQRTSTTDQRGCVHTYLYDLLGRLTDDCVTALGAGVDDRVQRLGVTYDVRGLPFTLSSYDSPDLVGGTVLNQVEQEYNSFGQVLRSAQQPDGPVTSTSPFVAFSYANGAGNTSRPMEIVYPNGRTLAYSYGEADSVSDRCSRVAALIDDDETPLAEYDYLGLGAIVSVTSPEPGLHYTLINPAGTNALDTGDIYSGLDRFGRVRDLRWINTASEADVVQIKYGYDVVSNRTWRHDAVASALEKRFDEVYSYDGLHRLKDLQRGQITFSSGEFAGFESPLFAQCWQLDATGNWTGFREASGDVGTWDLVQSRTANAVNEIGTITNSTGPAWGQPAYDAAGNMTTIPWSNPGNTSPGWSSLTTQNWSDLSVENWSELTVSGNPLPPTSTLTATYDAWNRLVKLVDTDTEDIVQENEYDARTFRTMKKDYTSGSLSETRHFLYTPGWRCVEERVDASTEADRQSVWGLRYIDDLILRDRDSDNDDVVDERLYALQDGNWNVVAIADAAGEMQQRLAYDAYGVMEPLTAGFVVTGDIDSEWETTYAGYRWDNTLGLYCVRYRMFKPGIGCWTKRDILQFMVDLSLYGYVWEDPQSFVDPFGLAPWWLTTEGWGAFAGALPGAIGNTFSSGEAWDGAQGAIVQMTQTTVGWTGLVPSDDFVGPAYGHWDAFEQGQAVGYYGGQAMNITLVTYGVMNTAQSVANGGQLLSGGSQIFSGGGSGGVAALQFGGSLNMSAVGYGTLTSVGAIALATSATNLPGGHSQPRCSDAQRCAEFKRLKEATCGAADAAGGCHTGHGNCKHNLSVEQHMLRATLFDACAQARVNYQRCFVKSDPTWADHQQQIAQRRTAAYNCRRCAGLGMSSGM